MTFANKFAAAIKAGGQILREYDNSVLIPFGAEYSVYLKNLNSVRALVKVSIDGTDTTGTWLIVEPNSDLELERFIRNGNFERGNRFKFIERSGEIEQHRGIKADDGLVRIEYKFEVRPVFLSAPQFPTYPPNVVWNNQFLQTDSFTKSSGSGSVLRSTSMNTVMETSANPGITVPGSESNQKFIAGAWFPTEDLSHVLVLQLRGEVAGKSVQQPVTIRHKPECVTCGRKNRATSKFCSNCGTALQLI